MISKKLNLYCLILIPQTDSQKSMLHWWRTKHTNEKRNQKR